MDHVEPVVVTGVGAITAQGVGAETMWQGLIAGRVAIRPVQGLDMTGYRTRLGGEVAPGSSPDRDAALDFALTAAREAMSAAGIRPTPNPVTSDPDDAGDADTRSASPQSIPATRWGVIVGTCNAGLRSAEHAWRAQRAGAPLNWRQYLMIQPQVLAEALSAEFGLRGPVLSVNTACASGAHAIAHAVDMIRSGRVDAMLVGGSDAFTETVFAGFNSLESLATRPAAPYSQGRSGLSLGEGSAMLVLTSLTVAHAARAPILAEVLGYGLSADGYHPTAPRPDGAGAARAITAALTDSGLDATAVQYINGHGTGTQKNDVAESNAVRRALGRHADKTPLSSVKSMIGHLLGAAAAVEAVATTLALRDQTAPPTAGCTEPDPLCGLDPIPGTGRRVPIDVALSNNFAFAGANATIAFARPGRPGRHLRPAASPARRSPDEVVITGVGVLTPSASSRHELWHRYTEGTSGIDNSIEAGGPEQGEQQHGLRVSRVDLDPAAIVSPKQGRRLDRLSLFALAACQRALDDAALQLPGHDGDRIGVILGTGCGPLDSLEKFAVPVLDNGPGAANPAMFPNTVYNAAAGQIATLLGARGPASTITAAHAAGAAALCVAEDMLRNGHAEALLCPAVDAFAATALQVYAAIPLFGPRVARRCRLAEGAVAFLLERRSAARARGARILGALTSHAITSDAIGVGQWDARGTGIERAMRTALTAARLNVGELSAIWANTTGLPAVDRPEHAALHRLLGTADVPIHQPKLVLGEPLGAGGAQSAALALQHWNDDNGLTGPALINSSSLGGTHICVILSPGRDMTR